jgi:uncharacterized membrane protein HdeD (DUF308 family)
MFNSELREVSSDLRDEWWAFLVFGIAWFVIAIVVLRLDLTSVATVGILLGAVFLFTSVQEFAIAALRWGGWGIFHVIIGIFFVGGAIWCFIAPFDAFWSLAAVLGLLLIIKGAYDITYAAMSRAINPLWWLGLVVGLLEIGWAFGPLSSTRRHGLSCCCFGWASTPSSEDSATSWSPLRSETPG